MKDLGLGALPAGVPLSCKHHDPAPTLIDEPVGLASLVLLSNEAMRLAGHHVVVLLLEVTEQEPRREVVAVTVSL